MEKTGKNKLDELINDLIPKPLLLQGEGGIKFQNQ